MAQDSIAAERLGRYQLLEPIGGGPNGTVSRAKVFGVAGFERQFAVKRFAPEAIATPQLAAALSAAARAYGGLEHPRIARMSEFGVAHGQTFTAVEFVAGLDAARLCSEARLAGGPLAAGGALALVSQAARAVGYAHGRGLTHLGLAPSNVIVTPDGDVKITDFGILAATMPSKPLEAVRFAQRIQYLAPEQLAAEAGSAATDVFSLGVIAYELVTGQRVFRGDTPAQVAQAIMAGPPPDPALPRPIVRVLQRCLARSPFERFPDARALADALDAALRVAPVPGTRRDVGAQVKASLDHLAMLNDGQLSGMVSLNLSTAQITRVGVADYHQQVIAANQDPHEVATTEFVRPDLPVAGPPAMTGLVRPESTMPDLPKPMTTVAGLPPPPIPVPQGFAPPPPPPPPSTPGSPTLLGMRKPTATPPAIPSIKPRTGDTGMIPTIVPPKRRSQPVGVERPRQPSEPPPPPPPHGEFDPPEVTLDMYAEAVVDEPAEPAKSEPRAKRADPPTPTMAGVHITPTTRPVPPPGPGVADRPTTEMMPHVSRNLGMQSTKPTVDLEPVARDLRANTYVDEPQISVSFAEPTAERPAVLPPPPEEPREFPLQLPPDLAPGPNEAPPAPRLSSVLPPTPQPARAPTPTPTPTARSSERVFATDNFRMMNERRSSRTGLWVFLGLLVVSGGGAAAWYGITHTDDGSHGAIAKPHPVPVGGTRPATKPIDAGTVVATKAIDAGSATAKPDATTVVATTPVDAGSAAKPADAAVVATVAVDAAPAKPDAAVKSDAAAVVATAPVDAGAASPPPTVKPDAGVTLTASGGATDSLAIISTPAGARLFIDGADQGVTPVKLPGSPDRHNAALLLPGKDLYVAQVDGHGAFTIPLKDIVPFNGPAGIKVLKCAKERYYVYVDGKPTGQTCPTERIGVQVGPHTVEVYDVVTETRKSWPIVVKDERLSFRVKVE